MSRLKAGILKLGNFFVIPRLSLILTLGSVLCFIFGMISPQFLPFIAFVPERILAGLVVYFLSI